MTNVMNANEPAKLLFVDDEQGILGSLSRLFRNPKYTVTTSPCSIKALEMLKQRDFDVIISDMRMPNLTGAQLLEQAATLQPNTIRMLLTGYADMNSAIDAINKGKIYKYLEKPWDNKKLKATVDGAIEEKAQSDQEAKTTDSIKTNFVKLKKVNSHLSKEVNYAKRELEQTVSFLDVAKGELEQTCETTVKTFASVINQRIGYTFKEYQAIVEFTKTIAEALGLNSNDIETLQYSALLFQLGKLKTDDTISQKATDELTKNELKKLSEYPLISEKMLMPFENMAQVRRTIRYHLENYDGTGFPENLLGKEIPLLSRILRVAADFNAKLTIEGSTFDQAINQMTADASYKYDEEILSLFIDALRKSKNHYTEYDDLLILDKDIPLGATISRDIYCKKGMLILSKGTYINAGIIERIKLFEKNNQEKIAVYIDKH